MSLAAGMRPGPRKKSHHRRRRPPASAIPKTIASRPARRCCWPTSPSSPRWTWWAARPGRGRPNCWRPTRWCEEIDALVLSGGSAFWLDAASGVSDGLRKMGRGFKVETATIPIVPGGDHFRPAQQGRQGLGPQSRIARSAAGAGANAAEDFALGTAGAGVWCAHGQPQGWAWLGLAGAAVGAYCGGAGRRQSHRGRPGRRQPALLGGAVRGRMASMVQRWAVHRRVLTLRSRRAPSATGTSALANTTIAIVATDADLPKAQAKRFAVAAQDGIARGCEPGAFAGRWGPDLFGGHRRHRSATRSSTSSIWGTRRRSALLAPWQGDHSGGAGTQ